jgi:phasin
MTESTPVKAAADQARAAYRKSTEDVEQFARDGQLPEAVRVFAEKNIAQTRELYDRSKDAFDKILESWEKTFDAAGQGAVALNRKVIDITQQNINSSFEFAKSLIGARTLAEAMALHSTYWQKQLGTLKAQADEMRALSTRVTADVAEPAKVQVKRGIDELERAR